jgi:hypothetical protein
MVHLSDWHAFDSMDRSTYPEVDAPVEVRFDDGGLKEGDSRMFFPRTKLLATSSIVGWRYIKGAAQR